MIRKQVFWKARALARDTHVKHHASCCGPGKMEQIFAHMVQTDKTGRQSRCNNLSWSETQTQIRVRWGNLPTRAGSSIRLAASRHLILTIAWDGSRTLSFRKGRPLEWLGRTSSCFLHARAIVWVHQTIMLTGKQGFSFPSLHNCWEPSPS